MEQFNWSWPKKINQPQVRNMFRLKWIGNKNNVIFIGGVGLGKTHIATALEYEACLKGYSVLFCIAVDAINNFYHARSASRLKQEMDKYIKPDLIVCDELGYLPIDKTGYEKGSLIITANRVFKKWPEIFNNDSKLTSALLDRLLHHAETLVIEGDSYRMKEVIET